MAMTEPGNIRLSIKGGCGLGCFALCPGLHHIGQVLMLNWACSSQSLTLKQRTDVVMGDGQA